MACRSIPFTASAILQTPDEADEVMGVSYTGFTSVTVYDGQDATGNVILAGGAGPQSILANEAIEAEGGVYIVVVGTGKGSLLV